MTKIAFMFPGQGSQSVGMGKDLYDNFEEARFVFDKADEVLSRSISKICFEGPDEDLKQTINTQPAILMTSIAALVVLKTKLSPSYVAGHSLGEYGALYASGVISLNDTIKLIAKRAELMSQSKGGAMAAVLGLADEKVKETLDEVKSGYVDVANYNCPGQVVITGEEEAIKEAAELLSAVGAKRVIPLAVSGAFHSQKMRSAADSFADFVRDFELKKAQIPVVTNVDAQLTINPEEFRQKMPMQIYSSVHWTKSVQKMIEDGVDTFIEVGPGKVLAGLVKKISSEVKIYNVYDKASLDACVQEISG